MRPASPLRAVPEVGARGKGRGLGVLYVFTFFFLYFSFLFLSSTFLLKHKLYITVFSSGQCCGLPGPQEKTSLCTWTVASPLGLRPASMPPGQPDFQGLREGWGASEFSGYSLAPLPTPQDKGNRRRRESTKCCSSVLHERRDGARMARRTQQKQVHTCPESQPSVRRLWGPSSGLVGVRNCQRKRAFGSCQAGGRSLSRCHLVWIGTRPSLPPPSRVPP